MAQPAGGPSSHPRPPPAPQQPSSGWLRSIDAVYDLFERPEIAAQAPHLSEKVRTAVRLCEDVIREVGWHRCALSFNGGKDCTVLVHILAAVQRRLLSLSSSTSSSSSNMEKFIAFSASPTHGYNLDLVTVPGGMKEGLRTYLEGGGSTQIGCNGADVDAETQAQAQRQGEGGPRPKRDIQCVFIGTRRDDPHGPSLSARSWTDADWPRVERIHPILTWEYKDVWDFLRCRHLADPQAAVDHDALASTYGVAGGGDEGVPYCLLYEQGYTSLGSTYNTHPNPVLRLDDSATAQTSDRHPVVVGDGTASGRWKPAYMLQDGSLERAGREGSSAASSSSSKLAERPVA
ncbi:related to FAD1 |uniref:FAD synthase n=1 Tax=Pseudozyma flocculosa TaxID=84751 RepID=A0A5C3F3S7_9BASI|nr:related to FAD1 \